MLSIIVSINILPNYAQLQLGESGASSNRSVDHTHALLITYFSVTSASYVNADYDAYKIKLGHQHQHHSQHWHRPQLSMRAIRGGWCQ